MKNNLTRIFPTSTPILFLFIILLILLVFGTNPAQAGSPGMDNIDQVTRPDQNIDPCDLMPSAGRISSQSEISCTAQFSSTPAEMLVQIQSNLAAVGNARLCSGLLEPSDFHIMMKEAKIGDCGIEAEVSYQGTPTPGYTGWMVRYYYQGISVRVATSQAYPANQDWVYDTANEIVGIIDDYLVAPETEDTESELPDWIKNPEVQIDDWGEKIYIPDWLDWIEPQPIEDTIRAVVNPIDGEAWIYNRKTQEWRGPAKAGDFLHSGEVIVVGEDSSMQIYVRRQGYIVTTTVTDNASLAFVPDETVSDYPILWQLYSGLVKIKRDYTGEPLPYEPAENVGVEFSTTTAIRSEAVLSYDPETKITDIYLIEGEIDYYNLIAAGPDDGSLISGEKLIIWGDGTEAVQPFDQSELESFLTAHNIKETDPLDLEEIEKLLDGTSPVGDQEGNGNRNIIFFLVGLFCCFGIVLIIGAVILILVFQARKKKEQGD
jgi:hypothetical protein